MKETVLRIFSVSLVVLLQVNFAGAQPTIYIVRHAEKVSEWLGDSLDKFHPLSATGMARAEKLAELFEKGSLVAIYSSPTTRTLHTVQPLAHKLWLQVQTAEACWDTAAMSAFFNDLTQSYKSGEAILLVSHSNHIPHLLIKAGLTENCWKEMGIVAPEGSGEIMIEGYDNIWKIEQLGEKKKGCAEFSRKRF